MGFIRLTNTKPTLWSGGSGWLNMGALPDSTLWPGGIVPFELDASVTSNVGRSSTAQAAILEWMNKTELVFVPRTNQLGWIRLRFDPGNNGASYFPLGNLRRRNDLVSNSYASWQLIAHELGHALGFIHEHQRPDRDKWVVADPTKGEQYQIVPAWPGVDETHGPYDCLSINHYPPDVGLSKKPSGGCQVFGWNAGVSTGDAAAIRKYYKLPVGRGVLHAGSVASRHGDALDLFTKANDSGIYTARWDHHEANGAWQGWHRIVNGVGTGTSPATVVVRAPKQLDVFMRGSNNGVYTAAWGGQSWGGWWRIGTTKTLSAVNALSRTTTTLDAFIRDDQQRVRHAVWDQHANGGAWQSWKIVRSGYATSDVTAVSRHPNLIDLFVRGADGGIWTAAWNGSWHGWWRIGGETCALGTNVAAASRTETSLDVVIVDEQGRVLTSGWDAQLNSGGWRNWQSLQGGVAALGTSPVLVARRADHLDVFVVGQDRRVWTASRYGTNASAAWNGWRPLFTRKVRRGSDIAAVTRSPDRLDVFMLGTDGRTYTAAWDQHVDEARWRGWWPVVS